MYEHHSLVRQRVREGPALLRLHAMGANRHMWDECATLWSPQFAVVACDRRVAGESLPPDRPWTPQDHANDVEAVRAEGSTRSWSWIAMCLKNPSIGILYRSTGASWSACSGPRQLAAHGQYSFKTMRRRRQQHEQ